MWRENSIETHIDTRDSGEGEGEVAEGKREGIKDGGGGSKTYRKREREKYLLTITCTLMCLIETVYSVLWVDIQSSQKRKVHRNECLGGQVRWERTCPHL